MSSLCIYCRRVPREFFNAYEDRKIGEDKEPPPFDCPEPRIVELHPSRASLTAGASEGCPLCTLILKGNEITTSESGGKASQLCGDGVVSVRRGAPNDPETISVICGSAEFARLLFTVIPEWWDAGAKVRSDVEVVEGWLKACDESHPNCQLPRQAFVPTRLVDLGPVDGNQVPRIQFGTNLKSQKIEYVALSYCWGTSMPELIKTTTQNIDDRFRNGFSAEICPATIKDAFHFTRALGLRYIWIDVLCILQDSERDWTTQSTKMGLVYSSAYFTLAASASPDTNSGLPFYIFTNTLNSDNTILPFRSNNGGKPERVCISVRGRNRTVDAQMASDPLQKRGWTVQERHLSYRVVHFSHENLLWECRQARSSTRLPWCPWCPLTGRNRRFFDGDKKALREHLDGGGWGRLIWDYSKRALTYERDKFYAIAGMVEIVDAVLACADQYLAGLWRSTLPVSLCWKSSLCAARDDQLTARLRAPSWSWASLNGPIYVCVEPLGLRQVYATVVGARTTASHDTKLGLKYEGWVRLKGPLRRAFLCTLPLDQYFLDANPDLGYNSELFEREGDNQCIGTAIVDVSPDHNIRYQEVFCLAVASHNRRVRVGGFPGDAFSESDTEDDVSIPDTLVSLLLAPTRKSGEYRRVGLSEYNLESTFECCEESVVTIV